MANWFLRRFSFGLVLAVEAVGALLLHESAGHRNRLPVEIVVAIVFGVVVVTILLLEYGIEWMIKRSDRAANWFGARLFSGAKVHGFWYTQIYPTGRRYGRCDVPIGASVSRIIPTIDAFNIEGDVFIYKTGKWTTFAGRGSAYGTDDIVYGYRGREGTQSDEGIGLYSFYGGDPRESFNGNFYGRGLPRQTKYRLILGERCPREHVTRKFRTDRAERQRLLMLYLSKSVGQVQPAPGVGSIGCKLPQWRADEAYLRTLWRWWQRLRAK